MIDHPGAREGEPTEQRRARSTPGGSAQKTTQVLVLVLGVTYLLVGVLAAVLFGQACVRQGNAALRTA